MSVKKEKQDKFSVTLRKDGIICIVEQNKPTEESTLAMKNQVIKKTKGKNLKFLVDLTRGSIPPAKARRNLSGMFEKEKTDKVAVIVGSVALRVMAKFIMATVGLKNFEFFNSQKEALEWLKKK